jgi:predicted nucleic acid-binding Zn ribbon protein
MFKPLHHILDVIENQPSWLTQQQFRIILRQWAEVVGETVADHTRPTGIDRQVLWVATSSPVWAQELSYKRQMILRKLSHLLTQKFGTPAQGALTDIKFSPKYWPHPNFNTKNPEPSLAQHPSYLPSLPASSPTDLVTDSPTDSCHNSRSVPEERLSQSWWQKIQARSTHLPLCPQCQCPTPPGELDRWQCCSLCATKKWTY